MTPFCRKDKITNESIPCPCGKCPACVNRRVSGWIFRLVQELKVSDSANFVTLTYGTEHIPITQNGFQSLKKRDVQLFFKKLRKLNQDTEKSIKYYACGEYGSKSFRPHYHIILFNANIDTIQKAWDMGNVHYGMVQEASIGYTLKYMNKKTKIPMHRNDDREREFPLMSKGLGKSYLTMAVNKWHKADLQNRMYLTTEDGKKVAMPRYYKEKLYSKPQKKAIAYASKKRSEDDIKKGLQKSEDYFAKQASQVAGAFKKQFVQNSKRDKI